MLRAMKVALWVIAGLIAAFLLRAAIRHRPLYPFMPFRYDFGKRRGTFRRVLRLLDERGAKTLIETGTARDGLDEVRSNGASTVLFGTWAQRNGAVLHSVDILDSAIERARQTVVAGGLDESVRLHVSDSIDFLRTFTEPVDMLYLDSYDYHKTDTAIQLASQEHHLAEFRAIEDRLHEESIVLIDDCRLPNGGKGKLVVDYMKSRGWTVLMEAYQVLLIRAR